MLEPFNSAVLVLLLQEVGSGNTSQRSDEEDFVKLDDVPLQLTVMCEVCKVKLDMSASMAASG